MCVCVFKLASSITTFKPLKIHIFLKNYRQLKSKQTQINPRITQINKNFRYNIPILTLERCKRCAHPHLSRSFHRFLNCQRPHYWIRRNSSTKCMMLAC